MRDRLVDATGWMTAIACATGLIAYSWWFFHPPDATRR